MKARNETVSVTLKAKVIEPQIGRNIHRRLVLIGHDWTGHQDFCAHGRKLRWHCEACAKHFKR